MLRKALVFSALCALAMTFPSLPPESTTYLLESTTDLDLTTHMYVENVQAVEFSADVESATSTFVEEVTKATADYNTVQIETFMSADFVDVTAVYSEELLIGTPDQPSTSMGSNEHILVHA